MKIVRLVAENIKRLVAVDIEPTGNMVQITGRNGAGKSSVLDALWWALAGTRTHQARPIRKGQEEARVELDLGDLLVKRKFRAHEGDKITTSIIVETDKGARFPSPQRVLDDLVGSLSFDPLAFCRLRPEEQSRTLCRLVGVDLAAFDQAQSADYQERRLLNRQAKELKAAARQIMVPEGTPAAPIDVTALHKDLQAGEAKNRERQQLASDRREQARRVDAFERDSAEAQREAVRLRAEAVRAEERAKRLEREAKSRRKQFEALPPLPPLFHIEPILDEIAEAHTVNKAVDNRERRNSAEAKHKAKVAESAELTKRMDDRKAAMGEKIASAKLPVDGLGLEDGAVALNGMPFDQASDAEQLRVSCAIAMSGNPKLRVLRIRDGSLLDKDSLKVLEEMAQGQDFQLWIEQVDTSGKVGFVIEDGEVKVGG